MSAVRDRMGRFAASLATVRNSQVRVAVAAVAQLAPKPKARWLRPFLKDEEMKALGSYYGGDSRNAWENFKATGTRQYYHQVPRPWASAKFQKPVADFTVGVELELIAKSSKEMEEIAAESRYYALVAETDATLPRDTGVEITSRPYSHKRWASMKHPFFQFVTKAVTGNTAFDRASNTNQGFHVNVSFPELSRTPRAGTACDGVARRMQAMGRDKLLILLGRSSPYGYFFTRGTHIELKAHRSCDNPALLREYIVTTVGLVALIRKFSRAPAGKYVQAYDLSVEANTEVDEYLDQRYAHILNTYYNGAG